MFLFTHLQQTPAGTVLSICVFFIRSRPVLDAISDVCQDKVPGLHDESLILVSDGFSQNEFIYPFPDV